MKEYYNEYYPEDYEPAPACPDPDCDGNMKQVVDNNYGADADGNRGIKVTWIECGKCGGPPTLEDE